MTGRPVVNLYWSDRRLGLNEQLCLMSFVAHGHAVRLHAHDRIDDLPDGVDLVDASRHVSADEAKRLVARSGGYTLLSDVFRLNLMDAGEGLWADMDVVATGTIAYRQDEVVFGRESDDFLNNAVLHLPPGDPVLAGLQAVVASGGIPFWLKRRHRLRLALRALFAGRPAIWDLPRGTIGPRGLTALAGRCGTDRLARPRTVFFPLRPRDAALLYEPGHALEEIVTPDTLAIHLWNEKLAGLKGTRPPPTAILGALYRTYGI